MLRVVERGLDLVQDVERARAREEHGEHEGERDERLLAARQQRQALGRLAGRRDLDLDAGRLESNEPSAGKPPTGLPRARRPVLLALARSPGSAPNVGSPGSCSSAPPSTGCGRGALTRRRRPDPPGNSRSMTSSKLRARGLERLLEALADAAVGLADQARAAPRAPPPGPCAAPRAPRRARALPRTRARQAGSPGRAARGGAPAAPARACELVALLRLERLGGDRRLRPRGRVARQPASARRRPPVRGRARAPRAPPPA